MKRIILFLFLSLAFVGGSIFIYKNYTKSSHPLPQITLESTIIIEAEKILSTHFKQPIKVESITQISEPTRRNLVLRLFIKNTESNTTQNNIPATVLLKQSITRDSSPESNQRAYNNFARDWAGLAFVNTLPLPAPIAPHFYGGNIEHHFILLEDLGQPHLSLATTLTTPNNATQATKSLEQFMINLGKLHGYSYQHTDEYLKLFYEINPNAVGLADPLIQTINSLESNFKKDSIDWIVEDWTPEFQATVNSVLQYFTQPSPFTTFIHGDICPDNTFEKPEQEKVLIIDFEKGRISNALLDAVYLRMHMPTCWCSSALPNEVIEKAEYLYRQELIKHIPAAQNDDAYLTAYVNACAFWMLQTIASIGWIVVVNKDKDVVGEVSSVKPRIISRLHSFIDVATQHNMLPELVTFAKSIAQKLKSKWPEVKPLPLFAAYLEKDR